MKKTWFLPAIAWLIISTILLVLPGDDLPTSGLFGIENFDKIVHLGMFSLLTILFVYPFIKAGKSRKAVVRITIMTVFSVVAYGFVMELVQKYWASDRSFDLVDLLFDTVGSVAGGLVISSSIAYKKIGPDGNRGRNQN